MSVKACPFCGGKNTYITSDSKPKEGCGNEIYFYVNCSRCTVVVVGRSIKEAYGEWNKRASDSSIALTFARKDYLFSKAPNGDGILIELDSMKVLLPYHLIIELMKLGEVNVLL